jgi:hypothetical protein
MRPHYIIELLRACLSILTEEEIDRDTERVADCMQCHDRRVGDTALDLAQIADRQAGPRGELSESHLARPAEATNLAPEHT